MYKDVDQVKSQGLETSVLQSAFFETVQQEMGLKYRPLSANKNWERLSILSMWQGIIHKKNKCPEISGRISCQIGRIPARPDQSGVRRVRNAFSQWLPASLTKNQSNIKEIKCFYYLKNWEVTGIYNDSNEEIL